MTFISKNNDQEGIEQHWQDVEEGEIVEFPCGSLALKLSPKTACILYGAGSYASLEKSLYEVYTNITIRRTIKHLELHILR